MLGFYVIVGLVVAASSAAAQQSLARMTEGDALERIGEFAALAAVTEFGQRRCASVPRVLWRIRSGQLAEWRGSEDVRWFADRAREYRDAMLGLHRALLQQYPSRQAFYAAEATRAEPRMVAIIQQLRQEADNVDRAVGGTHGGCWLLMQMAIENARPLPDLRRLVID